MMSSLFLVLSICTFLSTSTGQCLTGNDNPPTTNQDAKKILVDGRFGFGMDSLKIISEIVTQDNIFFSPHSLHQALMVVYLGARGTTETLLKQALHIPTDLSKVDVQRFYAFENTLNQIRKVLYLKNHDNSTVNTI